MRIQAPATIFDQIIISYSYSLVFVFLLFGSGWTIVKILVDLGSSFSSILFPTCWSKFYGYVKKPVDLNDDLKSSWDDSDDLTDYSKDELNNKTRSLKELSEVRIETRKDD